MKAWLIFLLLVAVSTASAVPSRREAFTAIETLEKNLLSDEAIDAAKVIMEYARDSKDVVFSVGPDTLPWVTDEQPSEGTDAAVNSLLLAAYFAGNAKSQLLSESTEDDPYSGWVATIRAYRQFQARGHLMIPSIDRLGEMQEQGKLRDHAREVKERERKAEQDEVAAESARNSI